MKSLLYQGDSIHTLPPGCGLDERQEIPISIRKHGRIYRLVLRDKIVPEDMLLIGVKAAAFAIAQAEPYAGNPVPRSVKDFLIKENVVG